MQRRPASPSTASFASLSNVGTFGAAPTVESQWPTISAPSSPNTRPTLANRNHYGPSSSDWLMGGSSTTTGYSRADEKDAYFDSQSVSQPAGGKRTTFAHDSVANDGSNAKMNALFNVSTNNNSNTNASRAGVMTMSHEELSRRISALDHKLSNIEQREVEGINTAQRTLTTIHDNIGKMGLVIANLETKISKDIHFLEDSIEAKIQNEADERVSMERQLHEMMREELAVLRMSVGLTQPERATIVTSRAANNGTPSESAGSWPSSPASPLTSTIATLSSAHRRELKEIGHRVARLSDEIDDKAKALEGQIESHTRELQQNVKGVLDALEMHRKSREANERSLVELIEDSCMALQREIEEEKKQRLESHKHLERVLLEAASRQWTKA